MGKLAAVVVALVVVAWAGYALLPQPATGQAGPPRGPAPIMALLDANGDGELSASEIDNAPKAIRQLDRDGDGVISRAEMPGGQGGFGPRAFRGMRPGPAAMSSPPPIPKGDAEKRIFDAMENLAGGRGMQNVPMEDGRFLRLLTESMGARHVVEIGTSNGYSGLWLSLGLRGTGGKLTTFEIDPERVKLARQNFQKAGVDKSVTIVQGDAHQEVSKVKEPIDLLFIDADKEGYADYLKKLLPQVRPGGLILAHNLNMLGPDYIQPVTTSADLETLYIGDFGVTLKKR